MRRFAPLLAAVPALLVLAGCSTSKPGEKVVQPLPTTVIGKVAVTTTPAFVVPAEYKGGDSVAGKQVFETAGCKSCHTLKDAGATGTIGPNLDTVQPPPSLSLAVIAGDRGCGRDAVVQGPADHEADRRRDGICRQDDRRQSERLTLSLPDDFPRDVRVVATDFDRTLTWMDGQLHERTLDALARTKEAGLHVIVVTGRMAQSVRRAIEPAALHDPVICYQGAVVADGDWNWLRHEPIPFELAREAIAAVLAEGYPPNVYVDDELYVESETDAARNYAGFQSIEFHVVGDLIGWLTKPPTKLVCVGEPEELDGVEARMRERFAGRLHISKSLPFFLEFAAAGVTKGSGLDFLSERMGFTKEQTIAFGDGENDVELLRVGGLRDRRRQRARPGEGRRRLGVPVSFGRGRGAGAGSASRLEGMSQRPGLGTQAQMSTEQTKTGGFRGIRRAWSLVDPHSRRRLKLVALYGILIAALDTVALVLIYALINVLNGQAVTGIAGRLVGAQTRGSDHYHEALVLLLITALLFVTRSILSVLGLWLTVGASNTADANLIARLLRGHAHAPQAMRLERNSAETLRTVLGSADQVVVGVVASSVSLISNCAVAVAVALGLFLSSPSVAAVVTVYFVVIGVAWVRLVRGALRTRGFQVQELQRERYQFVLQGFASAKELQLRGRAVFYADAAINRTQGINTVMRGASVLNQSLRYMLETSLVIGAVIVVAAAGLTGGHASVLPAVGLVLAGAFRFLPALNQILFLSNSVQFNQRATDFVEKELETFGMYADAAGPEEPQVEPLRLGHVVALEHVGFTYPTRSVRALDDVSITVRRGESLGVIGPTGSGKSTLLDVLLGVTESQSGSVTVDGVPMSSLSGPLAAFDRLRASGRVCRGRHRTRERRSRMVRRRHRRRTGRRSASARRARGGRRGAPGRGRQHCRGTRGPTIGRSAAADRPRPCALHSADGSRSRRGNV